MLREVEFTVEDAPPLAKGRTRRLFVEVNEPRLGREHREGGRGILLVFKLILDLGNGSDRGVSTKKGSSSTPTRATSPEVNVEVAARSGLVHRPSSI